MSAGGVVIGWGTIVQKWEMMVYEELCEHVSLGVSISVTPHSVVGIEVSAHEKRMLS